MKLNQYTKKQTNKPKYNLRSHEDWGFFFITEYKFYADLPSAVLRLAYCSSRYAVKKIGVLFITSYRSEEQKECRPAGRHDLNTL